MTKQELKDRVKNNHRHHPPKTEERISKHEFVRQVTMDCANNLIDVCPLSRELSLALTAMEEAMMWANAAIARDEE